MKKLLIYIYLICTICQSCNSVQQDISENKKNILIDTPKTTIIDSSETSISKDNLIQFIPKGFKKFGEYIGDLNLDSLEDKLLVVQLDYSLLDSTALLKISPDTFDHQIRPLIILLRQSDGTLKQVDRNDFAIQSTYQYFQQIVDPFQKITINKGGFRINYTYAYGPGGQEAYLSADFQFSKRDNDWFLSKIIESFPVYKRKVNEGDYHQEEKITTAKNFGKIKFKDYKRQIGW